MKDLRRTIVDAAWYVVFFLLIQFVCTSVCMLIWKDFMLNPLALGANMLASSLLTIFAYFLRRWCVEQISVVKRVRPSVYSAVFFLAVSSFLPSLGLLELLGVEENEQMNRIIMGIISSPLGFIVIALLVPLAEEIVLRGAFLRCLLDYQEKSRANGQNVFGKTYWLPIVISAIVFGMIHGNIAQFVHATILGILLGWLYANTRTIIPGVFLHFLNNTMAFLVTTYSPESDDMKLLEMFDGNVAKLAIQLVVWTAVLALSIWRLNGIFKENKTDKNQNFIQ